MFKKSRSEFDKSKRNKSEREGRCKYTGRVKYLKSHTGVRQDAKYAGTAGEWDKYHGAHTNSRSPLCVMAALTPAPIVVHSGVVGSAEDLGHLGIECTHNPRVSSSVVRCTGLAGVGQGRADERTCSAPLDELGEDEVWDCGGDPLMVIWGRAPEPCPGTFIEGGAGAGIGALGKWGDGGGAARLFAVEVALCGGAFVD